MAPAMVNLSDDVANNESWRTHTNPHGRLTVQSLRPINDLTRTAAIPGEVQYREYAQYLMRLGHVKHESCSIPHPPQPQNSILQLDLGDRNDNGTDFRAEQALWTMDNLPDVLYILGRTQDWLSSRELLDPPSKPYLIYGAQLRDIPILPDHISGDLEGWRYEAWVRLDPRIGYADIEARIIPSQRAMHKSRVQMRAKRFRDNFPLHGWVTKGKNFDADRQKLIQALQTKGVDLRKETTRGLSWGLVDRSLGEAGGRVPVPESLRQQPFVDTSRVSFAPLPSSFGSSVMGNTSLHLIAPSTNNPFTNTSSGMPPTTLRPSKKRAWSHTSAEDNQHRLKRVKQHRRDTKSVVSGHDNDESDLDNTTTRILPTLNPSYPITLQHEGHILTLKTSTERTAEYSPEVTALLSQWHPRNSEKRRRQLEWVLDPSRAVHGFWDVHHRRPNSDLDLAANCTDRDVVYADEVLPEHRGMAETTVLVGQRWIKCGQRSL